ncbi:DUF2147 domain-containing protein [Sphingomonas sp.]|uniref:DUF2147 domain-containing protein n=1 Tax=Sphingomonas sp. TaxID=28214 RepID=UPI0025D6A7F0|nr:DUF2147 domain-containing protein [Sphingomonas sp.]
MVTMLLSALILQPAEGTIDGLWANTDASVIIEIAPCGAARCGTVTWASDKAKADARKGTSQLVGTALLTGLRQGKDGTWHGRLFVPDQNIRAKAKLVAHGASRIRVSGCTLALFCKSQIWSRPDQ